MRTQLWITLGAIGATLSAAWMTGYLTAGSSPAPPRTQEELQNVSGSGITITPKHLDLGEVQCSLSGAGAITIRNDSPDAITVHSVSSLCACVLTTTAETTIESGESAEIQVEMIASSIVGRKRTKPLTLRIGSQPDVTIEVSCIAAEIIRAKPGRIIIRNDDPIEVTLTSSGGEKFTVSTRHDWLETSNDASDTQRIVIDPARWTAPLPKALELSLTHPRAPKVRIEVIDRRKVDGDQ